MFFVIEAAGAIYNPESLPAIVGLLVQHFEGRLNNAMKSTTGSFYFGLQRLMSGKLRRGLAWRTGDLLPLLDFVGLIIAAYLSLMLYEALFAPSGWQPPRSSDLHRMISMTAGLGAFVLYERRFDRLAKAADLEALARGFTSQFLIFLGVLGIIAFAGRWLKELPSAWLVLWLIGFLCLAIASRGLLLQRLRQSDRQARVLANPDCLIPAANVSTTLNGLVGGRLSVRLLADRPIRRRNALLKAVEDSILSIILLVLLAPVLAVIAVAIKLDSPGPVLFMQRRHGFKSREFDIYKFRTMQVLVPASAQGAALKQTLRGDARITRTGRLLRKYSLDELPQIFNVLEGTMSLVGPRPHAVNMRTEERLGEEIFGDYLHRHRVKPGITGWSQVNGARGATDTVAQLRRRVELDLYYVENWSLLLDLRILSRTFKVVLRATNAY